MKVPIQKTLTLLLLTCAAANEGFAQNAATSVEFREDAQIEHPPKPGPAIKRGVASAGTLRRGGDGRVLTFSAGHPFAERAVQPLIIQTSKIESKIVGEISEDMAVMTRILEKTISEYGSEQDKVLGLELMMHGSRSGVRQLFIDDYGMIFTLNVDIPLKATPKGEESEGKDKKKVDAEWENARNELFGTKRSHPSPFHREIRREFNAQEVNSLRDELLDALGNVANIRNLKDDHWITLVVRGRGSVLEVDSRHEDAFVSASEREGAESTMVLKVRKGDIDALAKRGLPKDEFRRRVTISTY